MTWLAYNQKAAIQIYMIFFTYAVLCPNTCKQIYMCKIKFCFLKQKNYFAPKLRLIANLMPQRVDLEENYS